ncbi:MAG: hypothetical protein R2822_22215 [Spirosomataceae bacterium]
MIAISILLCLCVFNFLKPELLIQNANIPFLLISFFEKQDEANNNAADNQAEDSALKEWPPL